MAIKCTRPAVAVGAFAQGRKKIRPTGFDTYGLGPADPIRSRFRRHVDPATALPKQAGRIELQTYAIRVLATRVVAPSVRLILAMFEVAVGNQITPTRQESCVVGCRDGLDARIAGEINLVSSLCSLRDAGFEEQVRRHLVRRYDSRAVANPQRICVDLAVQPSG